MKLLQMTKLDIETPTRDAEAPAEPGGRARENCVVSGTEMV